MSSLALPKTHPYANERRGKDHLISIRKDTRGIVFLFAQRNVPCTQDPFSFFSYFYLDFLMMNNLKMRTLSGVVSFEAMGNRIEDVYGMIFKFLFIF